MTYINEAREALTPERIAQGWKLYTGTLNYTDFRFDNGVFPRPYQLAIVHDGDWCESAPQTLDVGHADWSDVAAYRTFSPDLGRSSLTPDKEGA